MWIPRLTARLKDWQRQGKFPALVAMAGRLYHAPLQLKALILSPVVIRQLRQTAAARESSVLVDLTYNSFYRVIKPLQVRSEFLEMIRCVSLVRPRRVLEVGTANGATLFALTRSAADDAMVISVDLPGGLFGGGYPAWKQLLYRQFAVDNQAIELIRGSSQSPRVVNRVKALLGADLLDVLFLDGDHTYEGVKADYETYVPLLRPGGMLIFHDILKNLFDCSVGVSTFWSELMANNVLDDCREFIGNPNQGHSGVGIGIKKA
jgi:predicted O-methyltransferase YrrM